jgi:hypothetical protein
MIKLIIVCIYVWISKLPKIISLCEIHFFPDMGTLWNYYSIFPYFLIQTMDWDILEMWKLEFGIMIIGTLC